MNKIIAAIIASTFAIGAFAQTAATAPAMKPTPAAPAMAATPAMPMAKSNDMMNKDVPMAKQHKKAKKSKS